MFFVVIEVDRERAAVRAVKVQSVRGLNCCESAEQPT